MSDRISTAAAPTRPLMPNGEPLPQDFDEKLIHTVVHAFYDKVRQDELLGPVFNSRIPADQWPIHLNRMCDFWSSSFLRTDRYDGRPLPPHLGIAELSDAHFERWLELFHRTVDECCSPASASPSPFTVARIPSASFPSPRADRQFQNDEAAPGDRAPPDFAARASRYASV